MRYNKLSYPLITLFILSLSGCFTGVETTKKITAEEVEKLTPVKVSPEEKMFDTLRVQPFSQWEKGKEFFVTDNQVKNIFAVSSEYNLDTVDIQEKILTYQGYREGNILDNRKTVNIIFNNGKNDFIYRTDKTVDEIDRLKNGISIPFLIDMDMVAKAGSMLTGRELYIKTPLWYDRSDKMIGGRKYIPVRIQKVLPGNKIFPLKIRFQTRDGDTAYVFMATPQAPILNRSFDALFSLSNIRDMYPLISDSHWDMIIDGKIEVGMTKEEARLALGAPKSVDTRPTYSSLVELWSYENGVYLVFEDGILKQFRK